MLNAGKFLGKTIVITGASRGIGKEIALKLAKDGANIVSWAKTTQEHQKLSGTIYSAAEEIEKLGGKALPLQVDVRDEQQVQEAVEKAVKKFGSNMHSNLLMPFVDQTLCTLSENYFENEVTIEKLFNARVHLGHKVGTLNDNMKWALYGERLGVCVFDLDITRQYFIKALEFVRSVAFLGGRFLFISTNKSSMLMVESMAEQLGQYAHTRQWRPGTFTNTKGNFKGPIRLPDTVILLNTLTSAMDAHPALIESAKMCIPTVAIVDSNSESNYVCYPIPGNDDSIESANFYMEMFAKAIQKGQAESRAIWEKEKGQKQPQKRTMGAF